MAPLVGPHDEKYEEFYESWTKSCKDMLDDLEGAIGSDMKEAELAQEVRKVVEHYETYYKAKQSANHQDILQTVTPAWRSPLEKAFLWLGGWRPSIAFQLVYALAGQHIEAELAEFLAGVDTPSFASLTSLQLSQISELQTSTIKQEEHLSTDMAVLQQSFADQPLLALAQAHHMVQAQSCHNGSHMDSPHDEGDRSDSEKHDHDDDDCGDEGGSDDNDDAMDSAMQGKLTSLQEIAIQADSLRLTTLQKVLGILDTFQKAQYLIAAGKLQMAMRKVGQKLNATTAA